MTEPLPALVDVQGLDVLGPGRLGGGAAALDP